MAAPDFREHDEAPPDAYAVRPYALSGGRTGPTSEQLPVEALVRACLDTVVHFLVPERRRIVELTADRFLSIAELSAHVRLPVGVVRVIVSDLSAAGMVRVHGATIGRNANPTTSLSLLESVLDGISSL